MEQSLGEKHLTILSEPPSHSRDVRDQGGCDDKLHLEDGKGSACLLMMTFTSRCQMVVISRNSSPLIRTFVVSSLDINEQ